MAVTARKQYVAVKLITCIVPAGDGLKLAQALYETHALTGVNVAPGRGASQRSGTIADEVDIVTITVDAGAADAVFEFIYEAIEIETTPHRFMFQVGLETATEYVLPDLAQPSAR